MVTKPEPRKLNKSGSNAKFFYTNSYIVWTIFSNFLDINVWFHTVAVYNKIGRSYWIMYIYMHVPIVCMPVFVSIESLEKSLET